MLSIQEMIKLYIVKVLHKRQCWKNDGLRFLQTVHHCSSSYVGTTWNKTHDVLLLQTYAKLPLQPFNKNGLRSITHHLIKWLKKYMNFVMQENSLSANHWVTRPEISFETDTETFFETKYVRDHHQNFFFETNYFGTETETFFQNQIFWDRYWDFFKNDISFRIWLRIFTHLDISKL